MQRSNGTQNCFTSALKVCCYNSSWLLLYFWLWMMSYHRTKITKLVVSHGSNDTIAINVVRSNRGPFLRFQLKFPSVGKIRGDDRATPWLICEVRYGWCNWILIYRSVDVAVAIAIAFAIDALRSPSFLSTSCRRFLWDGWAFLFLNSFQNRNNIPSTFRDSIYLMYWY